MERISGAKRFFLSLVGLLLLGQGMAAYSQELDMEALLKPLVDTSKPAPETEATQPINSRPGTQTIILSGKVQTLQEAIVSERDTVNWYAWYLACREYLSRTGGLQCELGTQVKFHKGGRIEALSIDPVCIASVLGRRFDLPEQTSLDALILPVRNGYSPPASPREIYSRIEASKYK